MGGGHVRVDGGLVGPFFDEGEFGRVGDVGEQLVADAAGFLAGRLEHGEALGAQGVDGVGTGDEAGDDADAHGAFSSGFRAWLARRRG